jgi:hypothetical protein
MMSPSQATAKSGARLLLSDHTSISVPAGTPVIVNAVFGEWSDVTVALPQGPRSGEMLTRDYQPLGGTPGTQDPR